MHNMQTWASLWNSQKDPGSRSKGSALGGLPRVKSVHGSILFGQRMRKHTWTRLVAAMALGLSLAACQDPLGSKARQESEQLKSQNSALQKENDDLRSRLEQINDYARHLDKRE